MRQITLPISKPQVQGSLRFFVAGRPRPKARARVVMAGGKPHAYTPRSTAEWETAVKLAALAAGIRPIEGPVAIRLTFYLRLPKKQTTSFPVARPDLDNLEKAVLDALRQVLYHDDSQVVIKSSRKVYGQTEGVRVTARQVV